MCYTYVKQQKGETKMSDTYHHGNLKHELIENAISIIAESGASQLSLRSLSASCGVSHNAIYRHFDSKRKMIDCCREYVTQGLTDYLLSVIEGLDYTNPETIYKLSYSYIDYFRAHPTYFSFIYGSDSDCKIIFSLDKVEDNYPPFEIFRQVCIALIAEYKLNRTEGLRRLVRYWSLMHGAVSLMISPDVQLDGSWSECLKDAFLIGGKNKNE